MDAGKQKQAQAELAASMSDRLINELVVKLDGKRTRKKTGEMQEKEGEHD